jgi:hypothetical protein
MPDDPNKEQAEAPQAQPKGAETVPKEGPKPSPEIASIDPKTKIKEDSTPEILIGDKREEGAIGVSVENIPQVLDLQGAREISPEPAPVRKLEPLDKAGVDLSHWVLVMISGFVIITIAWIWLSEISFSDHFSKMTTPTIWNGALPPTNSIFLTNSIFIADTNSPSGLITITPTKETLELVVKARSDFREFWFKVFQTVLLNVLLPVLTALLGYVFGSRRSSSASGKDQ